MLKPPARSLHTQQQHHGLELPHTRLEQTPGPWFHQPMQTGFFAVLHLSSYLVNTPRKQRWGRYLEGQQKVASSLNLGAAEVLLGQGCAGEQSQPW